MTIFAEPQPVSTAIAATASAAMAKVEVGARYISPMWSIFVFNTVAIFTASFGTGLLSYIHNVFSGEFSFRSKHRVYAAVSIKMDEMFTIIYRQIRRIALIFDPGFSKIKNNIEEQDNGTPSIWNLFGYTRDDYRMFAYILPYTVPVLILVINGMLLGVLLAFFIFNGAISGYEIIGIQGIVIGVFYTFSYFAFSILPHGIIELPVLFLTATLGYRFAYVQSKAVAEENFFMGDDIESVNRDVSRINSMTSEYLKSRYLWTVFGIAFVLLLIAAYIEIYVTPVVLEYAMGAVEQLLNVGFA
ncbi:MAG: stage II sporulation protein M [Methanosarcinaceae archaeon]|nr:stage II sporulation protein M [Methanosarcinaceae archaeon]